MLYIQQQRYVIMKTHMEVKPKARKWWNKDCLKGTNRNRLFFPLVTPVMEKLINVTRIPN